MQVFIAILHVIGSVATVVAINIGVALLAMHLVARNNERLFKDIAISLGVTSNKLESDEMRPHLNNALSERFSESLFRNRLSDVCGSIRDLYRWGCTSAQVIIMGFVLWYVFTDSIEHAVYSWAIVGVTIFHWVTSYLFSKICWLVTGSHPGEPQERRDFASHGINGIR